MDIFKQEDLRQLLNVSGEWCVSLYLPTHRYGRAQQQDPIRFKNSHRTSGRHIIKL